jgi:MFS family permease
MVVLANALNIAVNPVISFTSDRLRTRWGRRIPVLAIATPFVSLWLMALGFAPEIASWLHHNVAGRMASLSPETTVVIVIGALSVCFQFFNLFVNSVFWYFFNDVVPQAFMGRFLGLFRVVSGGAGALFSYYVFPHAQTHTRAIFVGAAVLYFMAFMLMCWRVKEGKYPPPPEHVDGRKGVLSAARTYLVECGGHRLYWYFFLFGMFVGIVSVYSATFSNLLFLSLGVTLKQIGTISAICSVAGMVLTYPAGMLADRYHPLRTMLVVQIAMFCVTPLWAIFFKTFSPHDNYLILIGLTVVQFPMGLIIGAVGLPMAMRVLPRDRFGQFCSFNAILASGARILGGVLAGVFMVMMRNHFPDAQYGKDFCYRFFTLWQALFYGLATLFLVLMYREWKRLGGDAHYRPPGFDERPTELPEEEQKTVPGADVVAAQADGVD